MVLNTAIVDGRVETRLQVTVVHCKMMKIAVSQLQLDVAFYGFILV